MNTTTSTTCFSSSSTSSTNCSCTDFRKTFITSIVYWTRCTRRSTITASL